MSAFGQKSNSKGKAKSVPKHSNKQQKNVKSEVPPFDFMLLMLKMIFIYKITWKKSKIEFHHWNLMKQFAL